MHHSLKDTSQAHLAIMLQCFSALSHLLYTEHVDNQCYSANALRRVYNFVHMHVTSCDSISWKTEKPRRVLLEQNKQRIVSHWKMLHMPSVTAVTACNVQTIIDVMARTLE